MKIRLAILALAAASMLPAVAAGQGSGPVLAPGESAALSNELPKELEGVEFVEHLGETVPMDLRFTDDDGTSVTLADLLKPGRPLLIHLGYFKCPMMCSLVLNEAVRGLQGIEQIFVNGDLERRIPHNLNVSFNYVEGESLIMGINGIAVSSGSACTSASLEPSYVLRALGRSDELAHSSLRMTIGRFTTEEEVDTVVTTLKERVAKLRELSPLWDMYQEGIDISTIQWSAH